MIPDTFAPLIGSYDHLCRFDPRSCCALYFVGCAHRKRARFQQSHVYLIFANRLSLGMTPNAGRQARLEAAAKRRL
jgi:hypothetical protein